MTRCSRLVPGHRDHEHDHEHGSERGGEAQL
jgi:hypothetical protein